MLKTALTRRSHRVHRVFWALVFSESSASSVVKPRGNDDFQNRVLSAMRLGFGGHVEKA
jgi:6-phosphogluconate dehydrogenase (decarboxylating)